MNKQFVNRLLSLTNEININYGVQLPSLKEISVQTAVICDWLHQISLVNLESLRGDNRQAIVDKFLNTEQGKEFVKIPQGSFNCWLSIFRQPLLQLLCNQYSHELERKLKWKIVYDVYHDKWMVKDIVHEQQWTPDQLGLVMEHNNNKWFIHDKLGNRVPIDMILLKESGWKIDFVNGKMYIVNDANNELTNKMWTPSHFGLMIERVNNKWIARDNHGNRFSMDMILLVKSGWKIQLVAEKIFIANE